MVVNISRKVIAVFVAVLLAGCSLPQGGSPTPIPSATGDPVATQISLLITASAQAATSTLPPPDPTVQPPTDTPVAETSTATPEAATATPLTPTATLPPSGPQAGLGAPSWQDSLDEPRSFFLYENENTRVTHENGHLVLSGLTANGWHGWSLTFSQEPANFYLEAALIPQSCSGADLYGLVFRAPDTDSGYFFGVTCDGRYSLHARKFEDGTDIPLANLTRHSAILTGSGVTNRLGVMANGDSIGLYANGSLLQEVNASNYSAGNFGAFVAANETAGFSVWLDEVSLWNLP